MKEPSNPVDSEKSDKHAQNRDLEKGENEIPQPDTLDEPLTLHGSVSATSRGSLPSNAQVSARDTDNISRVSSGPPYSAFSKGTKIWIVIMITFSSFVSPFTQNVYFPALNPLAKDLHVSTSLINLTLTTYSILQGISPTFFGDLGDMAGRRPAFILAFSIYVLANIGLALQNSYVALLVLRCVQSAGSSGTIALSYAVVADIATTAERGKYMAYIGAGINIGPTLGPVLGGILSEFLGWRAIFWFCAIFVLVWLIPFILAVPETCRKVVGNGSIRPQSWNMTVLDRLKKDADDTRQEGQKRKFRFPNPLRTLIIIFEVEMGFVLFINSIIYVAFIVSAATLSTLFQKIYHYNNLQVGLCYLPYGFGSCIGVIVQGRILDWNYRRIAKKLGVVISRKRGDDLTNFPIETARIQPMYPMLAVGVAALIAYGWTLEVETSVAAPLVLTFIVGIFVPTSFNVLNTLIVDLNPNAPATATAANNLCRCLMGATATAVVEYMIQGMGRGWTFTLFSLLIVICMPGLKVIEKKGMKWRAAKAKREAKKQNLES